MEHAMVRREGNFMVMKGGKSYTVADIEALPEGIRAELIDGEIFIMASPTRTHQEILVDLLFEIELYIRKNKGECKMYPAPFGVYIKNDDRHFVEPDISVICDKEKLDEKGCFGAPDWVIEIVSPSSKKMDYERKVKLYREAGVREYWIVDAETETVTVYDFEHNTSCDTGHDTDERATHEPEPVRYSFSEQIKAGIYEDFYLKLAE